jgi:hypothetical protein
MTKIGLANSIVGGHTRVKKSGLKFKYSIFIEAKLAPGVPQKT